MKSRFFTSFKMTAAGIVAVLLAGSAVAWATITLNSSQVQKYQVGSATVETDAAASAANADLNFQAKTVTVTVDYGTVGASGFVAGSRAHGLRVTINAATGEVSASDGRQNLKLTDAQQQAVEGVLTSFQSQIEQALVGWGIVSGTAN